MVRKGELLSIIGPSGSGKSTLLTMLGAIETPTSGQILLEGTDYAKLGDDERTLLRRRRIGFIFQAFNLIPTLTALENVALPLELDGVQRSRGPLPSGRNRSNRSIWGTASTICPAPCRAASSSASRSPGHW